MDFDSLLSYCIKLNDSTCDKCLVCHIPIETNDEHLKLKCAHLFHKKCLGYKTGSIKCLYCEKSSIPELLNSSNKTNNVINAQTIVKQKEICCKVILKTGQNQGQYCNRQNCSYHKLQVTQVIVINSDGNKKTKPKVSENKKIIKINKCNVILKSGKNTGQECGRDLPCKYHHNQNNNENINGKNKINLTTNISNITGLVNEPEEHIENNDVEDLIEV